MTDPYAVQCPDCGLVFSCEFFMVDHQIFEHLPQPRGFIDLAIATSNKANASL